MESGIFLLLGGNLGDRWSYMQQALDFVALQVGTVRQTSRIFETEAWGVTNQPNFLNQVIRIETSIEPKSLLNVVQSIEQQMGRKTEQKWGSRVIDIDILYYNDLILETPELIIPHPQIPNRRFTLIPLVEIAPKMLHPVLSKQHEELLEACIDTSLVWVAKSPYEV